MNQHAHFLLAMVLAVLFGNPALGATYFVNNNGGSDFYTGTSATLSTASNGPWQTLMKLASVPLAPGDIVYLACGGVWKEALQLKSSGTALAPINVVGGPGNCSVAPRIEGASTISAQSWVKHSGSIYRTQLPIDLVNNPNQGPGLSGWVPWAASGNAKLVVDPACPGQPTPCAAFTSGTSHSVASSNNFPIIGGIDYTVGVQVRGASGTQVKVVLRRGGPTYESLGPEQWITTAGVWQSVSFIVRSTTSVPNARLDVEVPASNIRVDLREAHVRQPLFGGNVLAAFVDGLQIRTAHHPNFGQSGNAESPYGTVATAGGKSIADASNLVLPAGGALADGLGIAIRTSNHTVEERTVSSVTGSRLTLSAPTYYYVQPGYGFYLTGALWMLDSPGEWFYDSSTYALYVWMPDGGAPGNRVSVNGMPLGVDLDSKSYVRLFGVVIQHTETGVRMSRGTGLVAESVIVSDQSGYGINAENCVGCSVLGTRVERTGWDAVYATGVKLADFTMSDSIVSDSGSRARTDGWRVLPRTSRAGINAVGLRTKVLRTNINGTANQGVTVGANSLVQGNYVANTCQTLNDCAAIYINDMGNGTHIVGNVVENVRGGLAGLVEAPPPQPMAVGILFDDLNADSVAMANTITGAQNGIQIHNAHRVTVRNNVLFGNRNYQLWLQEHSARTRANGDIYGNRIESNVVVPTTGGPAVYLESTIGDTTDFATFSGNHYSALFSPRVVAERWPTGSGSYSVAEWQAAGRETLAWATAPVGYASFLAGADNLVPNGNVASGTTGWIPWSQLSPAASVRLRSCSFGPCMDLTSGASTTILSSPNFATIADQWYRVSFDAATGQDGQAINVVVRRGGGVGVGYEYLMPAAESFAGSTAWKRYAFVFQAKKTIAVGNGVTSEFGARIDFERNHAFSRMSVARLEMVALSPAQAALHVKLLLNTGNATTSVNCASMGVAASLCNYFVSLQDNAPVYWPAPVSAMTGLPIFTRDISLTDTDGDGIADQQDACPSTQAGQGVDARGCPFRP